MTGLWVPALWVVCALALAGAMLLASFSPGRGSGRGSGPGAGAADSGAGGPGAGGPALSGGAGLSGGSGLSGGAGSGSPDTVGLAGSGNTAVPAGGRADGWAGVRWRHRTGRAPAGHLGSYVLLVAAALRGGQPPPASLEMAAAALPGETSARIGPHLARLRVGADPAQVWTELARDDVLGPLGRVLARAHRTGAPVAEQVMRLADELAERDRADQIDAARRVGVKAALPLGLCLLPSFLLLGIVPMAAGLLGTVLG